MTLAEVGISTRVANLLAEAGYETAGSTLEQLEIDEDKILALQGIGPKAITELREVLPGYDYPEPVVEEELLDEDEEQAAAEDADADAETETDDAQVEAEGEAEAKPAAEAEPEAIPIEEAFNQAIEEVAKAAIETDDDEATEAEKEAERKKRKQRARVVEYDPDLGENGRATPEKARPADRLAGCGGIRRRQHIAHNDVRETHPSSDLRRLQGSASEEILDPHRTHSRRC